MAECTLYSLRSQELSSICSRHPAPCRVNRARFSGRAATSAAGYERALAGLKAIDVIRARMACPSTPPCGKPKDHDLVNLDCDIATGLVSFQHPLESCRSKCGRPPLRLERIVLAFNESKSDGHDGMVRAALATG